LPAGRHVAPAKIGDRGDAAQFGDAVGVADLQRERQGGRGPVAHGLAVAADRGHLRRVDPTVVQELADRQADEPAECGIGLAQGIEIIRAGLA